MSIRSSICYMLNTFSEPSFHVLATLKIIISLELTAASSNVGCFFTSSGFISLSLELEKCPCCSVLSLSNNSPYFHIALLQVLIMCYVISSSTTSNCYHDVKPSNFPTFLNVFISWVIATMLSTISVFIFSLFYIHVDDFPQNPCFSVPWMISIDFCLPCISATYSHGHELDFIIILIVSISCTLRSLCPILLAHCL